MQHRHHRFPRMSRCALAVALGLGLAASMPAMAQSNATTTIYGTVPAGNDVRVVLVNNATGVQRTIQPDANGYYRANSLPPGHYQVRVLRGDQVVNTAEVDALVGSGVEASYNSKNLGSVVVSAAAHRIDVTNTNNGVVLTATELQRLPVANDVASVVQLTPGTVRGTNSQYGNAPSIGGAGQSENSFYVNGFPVTNILTQVGSTELPFGAISNMQVLTGGYGAEFGRSTGGVINITTKSGGNTFQFGGKVSWTPNALRGTPDNTYWPNTGVNPKTDGKLQYYNQDNSSDSKLYALYASGPIIRDKLFFFAALEQTRTDSESIGAASDGAHTVDPVTKQTTAISRNGWYKSNSKVSRGLVKLDYNLTDNHHFEFTKMYDRTQTDGSYYGFNYSSFQHDNVQQGKTIQYTNCCGAGSAPGSDISIFKYTGYLTDRLTVTALWGDSRTSHHKFQSGYDPSLASTSSSATTQVPGVTYPNPQTASSPVIYPGSGDNQKGGRFDLQYRIGHHDLRAGLDRMFVNSTVGSTLAGGYSWSYLHSNDPNYRPNGATETLAQGGGYGTQGYYVSKNYYDVLAHPSSVQSAQYIQDLWQVSDHILLDLGLRREQFTNYTSDGKAFISQKNMIAPRFGMTWDYFGDGTLKLFANAGRYHLPVPSNLSSNLASPLTITSQYFTYTGVDQSTGAPTGLNAISGPYSANNMYGTARDAREIVAIGLKPLSQDEASIGFEKALANNYIFGASLLYRHLNQTNDDNCDQRPIDAWAARNGVDESNWDGFACAVINPGRANSLWIDFQDGHGERRVDISAAEWGLPKATRVYKALNMFLEHPYANGWYGRIEYTLSSLKGDMEGQVDTIGGGDVALTVSDDHKELMYNSYGYLPSDRRHAIKAFGYVKVHPEVMVGANLSILSGAPRNCIGNLPANLQWDGDYGAAYFYCNGQPAPRGSQGRLPWLVQLDTNVTWTPHFAKGLSLKMDVFNLFNSQIATRYAEHRELADGTLDPTYLQITGRQAPRSIRLTAEYTF